MYLIISDKNSLAKTSFLIEIRLVGPGKNLDKTMAKVEEFQMGVFLSKERNRDFIAPHIGQGAGSKGPQGSGGGRRFCQHCLEPGSGKVPPGKAGPGFCHRTCLRHPAFPEYPGLDSGAFC